MFKKRSALNEAATNIASQMHAALAEATPEQKAVIKSGEKLRSPFLLGYFTGSISLSLQNRGLDGYTPGKAVEKVARKVQGDELATTLGWLAVNLETGQAKKEYEQGQNAALVEELDESPTMLKDYFLGKYNFAEDGNMPHA